MQLYEFLVQWTEGSTQPLRQGKYIFCYPEEIPLLFISRLLLLIRHSGSQIQSLDAASLPYETLISHLEVSFLGEGLFYWIKGIETLEKTKREQLLKYINRYQGAHSLLFCVDEKEKKILDKSALIMLPTEVDMPLFEQIFLMGGHKRSPSLQAVLKALMERHKKVSIDSAFLIAHYIKVAGYSEQILQFLEKIIAAEKSLFVLSQHFFSRNTQLFFSLWQDYRHEYPLAFWLVFWTEQVWRAYFVRYYMEQRNSVGAKTMSFRLPFSFLQKEWRTVSLIELKQAHQFLYELDYTLKRSAEIEYGLELFYSKFFGKEFAAASLTPSRLDDLVV